MEQLEVASPVADAAIVKIDPAPRPSDLEGKRIGLYWNYKPGGDVALKRIQEILAERFPSATFVHAQGSVGGTVKHLTPKGADDFASQIDVVVGTTGD